MEKITLPPHVEGLCGRLRRAGFQTSPVGGAVRDSLLGRAPEDWDVCTAAPPEAILALFPGAVLTGGRHGTVTVPTDAGPVEVTPFRREFGYSDSRRPDRVDFGVSLEEDLSRRDFTVNAMALDEGGRVVDPFGGRADLSRRLIRCVGDPDTRFAEDALRMLRAVRFSAQLDFTIEEKTRAALARNARRVEHVSRERVRAELEKTLLSPRPERVGEMAAAGLLDHLYPFPEKCDLSGLASLPPTPAARWRGFCSVTGFPISALPVERRLRRAVEHPELAVIPTLALTGGDLMALGLRGPEVSAAQRALALHVLDRPEDNTRERLLKILEQSGHIY